MINDHFVDVCRIADDILKFKDILPDSEYIYYLGYTKLKNQSILVVSQDIDDVFASKLIQVASFQKNALGLLKFKHHIENKYGFNSAILAGAEYHDYFKGRLDDVRKNLTLCLPIFECEFSGYESIDLFYAMRIFLIESLNWKRPVTPKILLQFDNPKTKGGTKGKKYVPVKFNVLKAEIANLSGVLNGFIEVRNYCDEYAKITSTSEDQYIMEVQEKVVYAGHYLEIEDNIWNFLSQGTGSLPEIKGEILY